MLLHVLQEQCMQYDLTRSIDPIVRAEHMRHGSVEELGEMAGMSKRMIRDGRTYTETEVAKEFFDRIWYLVGEIDAAGLTLEMVAQVGLAKLKDRQERGVIKGEGGSR